MLTTLSYRVLEMRDPDFFVSSKMESAGSNRLTADMSRTSQSETNFAYASRLNRAMVPKSQPGGSR